MIRSSWRVCLTLLLLGIVFSLRSQTPDAKAELDLGIAAYEKGAFDDAVQHLRRSVSLEPSSKAGHYYLASTYNLKCIPWSAFCDAEWSRLAVEEYTKVLEIDPSDTPAMKGMGRLLYTQALSTPERLDDAEPLYRKAALLNPNDPEALYAIAAFDWMRTFRALVEERNRFGLSIKQPLIGLPTCRETRVKSLPKAEEGLALLTRTLQIVNSADAQVYVALLYMARADLQCGDRAAYKRDQRMEQQWWNRACVTWHEAGRRVDPNWLPIPPPPPRRRGDTCTW